MVRPFDLHFYSHKPCVIYGAGPVDHDPGWVCPAGLADGWRHIPLPFCVVHLAVGGGVVRQQEETEEGPQCGRHDGLIQIAVLYIRLSGTGGFILVQDQNFLDSWENGADPSNIDRQTRS